MKIFYAISDSDAPYQTVIDGTMNCIKFEPYELQTYIQFHFKYITLKFKCIYILRNENLPTKKVCISSADTKFSLSVNLMNFVCCE
jgi:hypothetical protein